MGGESRFPFTSVWMMGLARKGELQDLCFQARGCKWEKKMIVSPFCANTSADHSWLAASDSGYNISLFVAFLASLPGRMMLLLRESHLVL